MREVEFGFSEEYSQLRLPHGDVPYVYREEEELVDALAVPTEYPRQLYLPYLPDGLIQPADFQRRYESDSVSLFYSMSTRYDRETGEMVPDGIGIVLASHDIASETGDIIRQENLHIGYDQGSANYVSSIVTDVAALRRQYEQGISKDQSVQTLSLSHDGIDEDSATQRVTRNNDHVTIDLIFSSDEVSDGQVVERGERVSAPATLTVELSHLLMAEGKNRLGSDSDRSNNGEVGEILLDSDETLYQVPKKFPVTFTPFESTLIKR